MSRLLNNSEQIRTALKSRNLYSFDSEYPQQSQSFGNQIIDAVNSISSVVRPYSGYDLSNTVFGRIVGDRTPISEIGLVMLGKQFAFSATKRAATEIIPTVKPLNLFLKGEPLISLKKNYRITRSEDSSLFQRFLDITTFYTPARDNIFDQNSTNLDYLRNTGDFQLDVLASQLNRNLYVGSVFFFDNTLGDRVKPRNIEIVPNKTYFTTNEEFTAYDYKIVRREDWVLDGNVGMRDSASLDAAGSPEYAPDLDFVKDYFGKSDATPPKQLSDLAQLNDWVDEDTGFSGDNDRNKIIWGRDGASANLNNNNNVLRGVSEEEVQTNLSFSNDLENKFNNRKGLLAYTRNLINAKGGQIGDITRKAFKRGNEITGFNGSGLWKAPENALESFRGREGIRQHTVLDQYDRFAKAIRFQGNIVYEGNENSVVYKSVIPKIHPVLDEDGRINNKNMMFAIENLAVKFIDSDGGVEDDNVDSNFRYLDDEYSTKIPKCEVGQFGGRVMWFPPYNLEFVETSTANFESTVMVGRNEPVYNYLHGERSGTIRFTLIMDYPPHLKNYKGINKHKDIAEFFAFGGEGVNYDLPDPSDLLEEVGEIIDPVPDVVVYDDNPPRKTVKLHFPNDVPNYTQVSNVFDLMHRELQYEMVANTVRYFPIFPDTTQSGSGDGSGNNFGLNFNDIYRAGVVNLLPREGVTAVTATYLDEDKIPQNFSQYSYNPDDGFNTYQGILSGNTVTNIRTFENQKPVTNLDNLLKEAFADERNFQIFKIVLTGSATKRFADQSRQAEYNRLLALRRIESVKKLIDARLKVLFDTTLDASGIEIEIENRGSRDSQSIDADTKQAKKERFVEVKIARNDNRLEFEKELISDQKKQIEDNNRRREELNNQIAAIRRTHECYLNERGTGDDKGLLKGFQAASGRYFSPVFHSQTPEDFHRRLTFLQQCLRQGRAMKSNQEIDDDGIVRARNSVFGRQPICVLRIGDFFHTKIIIENLTIDYDEAPWDTNPEGFGMQPMIANITLQIKIMGGQSLKGPIDALQNAVSFNYYANSTFVNQGIYRTPSAVEATQYGLGDSVKTDNEQAKADENMNNNLEIKPMGAVIPIGNFQDNISTR